MNNTLHAYPIEMGSDGVVYQLRYISSFTSTTTVIISSLFHHHTVIFTSTTATIIILPPFSSYHHHQPNHYYPHCTNFIIIAINNVIYNTLQFHSYVLQICEQLWLAFQEPKLNYNFKNFKFLVSERAIVTINLRGFFMSFLV